MFTNITYTTIHQVSKSIFAMILPVGIYIEYKYLRNTGHDIIHILGLNFKINSYTKQLIWCGIKIGMT
jgi:hypothetical protein